MIAIAERLTVWQKLETFWTKLNLIFSEMLLEMEVCSFCLKWLSCSNSNRASSTLKILKWNFLKMCNDCLKTKYFGNITILSEDFILQENIFRLRRFRLYRQVNKNVEIWTGLYSFLNAYSLVIRWKYKYF